MDIAAEHRLDMVMELIRFSSTTCRHYLPSTWTGRQNGRFFPAETYAATILLHAKPAVTLCGRDFSTRTARQALDT